MSSGASGGTTLDSGAAVLQLEGVGMVRGGRTLLSGIDWDVQEGERWVVLGPNGSGKTTLARVATLWEHPSSGSVRVLGEQLGRTDVRRLRSRIGFVSSAMAELVRPQVTASEVVMCGLNGALEPWWHDYDDDDRSRAASALRAAGLDHLSGRTFGTLSSGERQRVLLARAHVIDPGLVVLDEPNAGLDLGGRESLVDDLELRAAAPDSPPVVLVTHHVEEIPPSFTHLLALRSGSCIAAGPIGEVLDESLISETFGIEVDLLAHEGRGGIRWSVRRR